MTRHLTRHLILVHGAWGGSWVWDSVLEPLRSCGFEVHPVDLPGTGTWEPDADITIDTLAAEVVALAETLDGPIYLAGHSGGGTVATHAAEQISERTAGIAYVAGMMLPSGVDYNGLCEGFGFPAPVGISAWLEPTDDGLGTVIPPEAAATVFFHQAPAADAIAATRRIRPQLNTALAIAPTWSAERFGTVPRLYIEATLDRCVPIETQREMQRRTPGAQVVTLECDHAPQLSAPKELVDAIAAHFS